MSDNKHLDTEIPQDFLDIDPITTHWVMAEYGGTRDRPALWTVPDTEANNDMTDAMMSEIPGQDDTVTPLRLTEQRFYKFCMAYLMQDGNLGVPGGRYGSDTRNCAEIAIIMSLCMKYHNGEPISYYSLHSDMGTVVNSGDGVATLISESGYILEDLGLLESDPKEILGDAYEPQTPLERLAKWAEVDISDDTVTITFDEQDAERLVEAIENGEFKGRQE